MYKGIIVIERPYENAIIEIGRYCLRGNDGKHRYDKENDNHRFQKPNRRAEHRVHPAK